MSKFKIAPKSVTLAAAPASIEAFGAGAAMVKTQSGDRPEKPVRLNLDIEPALHRRLKQVAFDTDTKIAVLVRRWIGEGLGRQ